VAGDTRHINFQNPGIEGPVMRTLMSMAAAEVAYPQKVKHRLKSRFATFAAVAASLIPATSAREKVELKSRNTSTKRKT
jgi:hypothetical protein